MAITYANQTGTQITTSLVGVNTLGSQVGAGANEIYIAATGGTTAPSTADDYNGNVGNGTSGLGDTYVGRIIVVRKGTATQEIRIISAEAYAANVQTLTVSEPWDVQPVSGDAYDVCYEPGDIVDGGQGGGIGLSAKTGLYELTNLLTINSTGFLQLANGNAMEHDDDGANISLIVQSGGYFIAGLLSAGADISGGVFTAYNNTTGEPSSQIQSGGYTFFFDTLIWAQLRGQQYEVADGANGNFSRVKWLSMCDELHLFDATLTDCSASGRGAVTDIIRVDAGTTCNEFVVSNVSQIDTVANTTTETIELTSVLFASVPNYITIRDNKTWNMIDPVWDVVDHTDFDETNVTGTATINDRTSIAVTVQEADGTLLQDALVNVYTHEQSIDGGGVTLVGDLELELVTDVNGFAADSFIYTGYNWAVGAGTNTVYSGHALQCGKWLYEPFVATQSSTDKFGGAIVLSPDPNIVQTTQATAITAGSGITWNEDANPSEIFEFTLGTGTPTVGETVTFSPSGATGIVTQLLTGDGIAGTIHLRSRNATAIANGDTFSSTSHSGTYTNDSSQAFSIWIDCNDLSMQTVYDYLSARQTETTLTATGELIWEWCRDGQSQPVYATGSSFFTETSNSKGIFLVDYAAGTVDYMTDDAGVTYTPPQTYTLTVGRVLVDSDVYIYEAATKILLASADPVSVTDGAPIEGVQYYKLDYTFQTPSVGTACEIKVFNLNYVNIRQNYTLIASDARVEIQQRVDRNYFNP
jgi:hypothetical protein